MPSIPINTVCQQLGCKDKRSRYNSYCLLHGGRDTLTNAPKRRVANAMYNTPAWRIMRMGQLSTQPLCQACLVNGKINPANHVDHVFRWQDIDKGAFYNNILQSLCLEHHSHKTGLENKGIYVHYSPLGIKRYSLRDYDAALDTHAKAMIGTASLDKSLSN
ncbi:hypothetical protein UFOVP924_25 [uncultured Caudovirales phage]|uniref:HNHc domain containing protein n=1 Tax=uncultured Caudovirales phage TaxID=2100421 RepID=A0A6J5RTF8_9CAUD|nr:hypothetical protein UFOVP924_25 [uncultured Caudovirales phage]CAB4200642.1 hypothetical protein UFOVP1348_56 [uncultured Caudovirales phage]